ncbi:hypothetical protein S245_029400, partial [Arachis hypogaea]
TIVSIVVEHMFEPLLCLTLIANVSPHRHLCSTARSSSLSRRSSVAVNLVLPLLAVEF